MFFIKAMLTVNSGLPFINSFVPSKGSIKKKKSETILFLFSSEMIEILLNFFFKPETIILLLARSAWVNGD